MIRILASTTTRVHLRYFIDTFTSRRILDSRVNDLPRRFFCFSSSESEKRTRRFLHLQSRNVRYVSNSVESSHMKNQEKFLTNLFCITIVTQRRFSEFLSFYTVIGFAYFGIYESKFCSYFLKKPRTLYDEKEDPNIDL